MQFLVKDGSTNLPVAGATVIITKDSDGTLIFSGTTDADGKVDPTVLPAMPCDLLAFKPGEYDGVKVSIVNSGGVLYPASVSLLKISSRIMKVDVFIGNFSTPLNGARVEVKNASGASVLVQTTSADGRFQTTLQADLAGWTVTVTQPGVDGVVIPLDKIDLVGEVKIVLEPAVN